MSLPPPCGPLVRPVQAIPGDYRIGDAVYSLISFSNGEYGSFEPGAKGPADTDRDTELEVEFEGYGRMIDMALTQISRDPDPNNVRHNYCTLQPP